MLISAIFSCSEVEEPTACYTESSWSEKTDFQSVVSASGLSTTRDLVRSADSGPHPDLLNQGPALPFELSRWFES